MGVSSCLFSSFYWRWAWFSLKASLQDSLSTQELPATVKSRTDSPFLNLSSSRPSSELDCRPSRLTQNAASRLSLHSTLTKTSTSSKFSKTTCPESWDSSCGSQNEEPRCFLGCSSCLICFSPSTSPAFLLHFVLNYRKVTSISLSPCIDHFWFDDFRFIYSTSSFWF